MERVSVPITAPPFQFSLVNLVPNCSVESGIEQWRWCSNSYFEKPVAPLGPSKRKPRMSGAQVGSEERRTLRNPTIDVNEVAAHLPRRCDGHHKMVDWLRATLRGGKLSWLGVLC